ncbi:conserved Plasmodium protein, unknown function [Plasmodium vivax]|nr:conserved Plasmodium protein, unknown function [Plasmodium vivax]
MQSVNSISSTEQLLHFFDSLIADGYIITILGIKHVLKLSSDLCQKFILYYFENRKDQLCPTYLVEGFNKSKTEYICSIFHETDALRMLREGNYTVNIYSVQSNKNKANLSALWKQELNEIHKTCQKDAHGQPIIPEFSNMLLTDVKAKIDEYSPNACYQFPHIMYIAEENLADKEAAKSVNLEQSVGNAGTHEKKNGRRGRNCNKSRASTECIDIYLRKKKPKEEKVDPFQPKEGNESNAVAAQGMNQMMGATYVDNMVGANYEAKMEDTHFADNMVGMNYQQNLLGLNFDHNVFGVAGGNLESGVSGGNFEGGVSGGNLESGVAGSNFENAESTTLENNNWKSFMSRMIQSTNAKIAENNMKERKTPGRKRKVNIDACAANDKKECAVGEIINGNENKPKRGRKPKAATVVVTTNKAENEGEAAVAPSRRGRKKNELPKEEVENDEKQMKLDVSNNDLNVKMPDFDSSFWEKESTEKKISSKIVYTEEEAQEDESVGMFYENGYFVVVDKSISKKKRGPKSQERKNKENAKENSPFDNKNKKDPQQTLLTNFFKRVA